jgi:YD repeat-containing protein
MVAITDAIGQVTTLAYAHGADPLLLTTVTDPFGRVASLGYDAAGRLASITDAARMVSTFNYGPGDFIVAMTTPYGTTSFRHEGPVGHQMIEAIDPVGGRERLEFQIENTALAQTEPSNLVPTGFTHSNLNLHRYNSVYWDKLAMARHPGDVTQATITSWMFHHDDGEHHHLSHNVPHSIKKPLENRVWYRYEGQTTSSRSVNYGRQPALIGRVLDDGASQVTEMSYNSKDMVTSRIDPLGRHTNYTYATNGLDLLTVEQVRSGGTDVIQSYSNYNSQHLPGTITDAAGQDPAGRTVSNIWCSCGTLDALIDAQGRRFKETVVSGPRRCALGSLRHLGGGHGIPLVRTAAVPDKRPFWPDLRHFSEVRPLH